MTASIFFCLIRFEFDLIFRPQNILLTNTTNRPNPMPQDIKLKVGKFSFFFV